MKEISVEAITTVQRLIIMFTKDPGKGKETNGWCWGQESGDITQELFAGLNIRFRRWDIESHVVI